MAHHDNREMWALLPVDAAILSYLPKEGAKVGFHNLGTQVKALTPELSKVAPVTSPQISARVRVLAHHGYVVSVLVMPVSHGPGYQRTPSGDKWMREQGFVPMNEKETVS